MISGPKARFLFGSLWLNGNSTTFPRRSLPAGQNFTAYKMQQVLCSEENSSFALDEELH